MPTNYKRTHVLRRRDVHADWRANAIWSLGFGHELGLPAIPFDEIIGRLIDGPRDDSSAQDRRRVWLEIAETLRGKVELTPERKAYILASLSRDLGSEHDALRWHIQREIEAGRDKFPDPFDHPQNCYADL